MCVCVCPRMWLFIHLTLYQTIDQSIFYRLVCQTSMLGINYHQKLTWLPLKSFVLLPCDLRWSCLKSTVSKPIIDRARLQLMFVMNTSTVKVFSWSKIEIGRTFFNWIDRQHRQDWMARKEAKWWKKLVFNTLYCAFWRDSWLKFWRFHSDHS